MLFRSQIGTPQEVYDQPINMFVAGFIGVPQMNFYDGKLIKNAAGKYAVQVENAVIELSDDKQKNLAANNTAEQDITVGVRPEHITLNGDPDKMITGKIDVFEMMGSAVHLHINAMGKDGVIIVPTLELGHGHKFEMGSEIRFTFPGSVAHVFSKDTAVNLETAAPAAKN